jgi:IS5 family transposase
VFRTISGPVPAWESLLPPELLRLPEELARVDALLDDPAFFAPFAPYFHPVLGRPSTPVECYLRLMFGKFRYRLGYESLCAEVSDSISWRRFCRIGLDAKVPHPTTLMKLTTRCGEAVVAGLNEALLARAAGQKLLRTARVRADTTVIGANVAYPTDAGLLAKAAGKLVRAARRVQAAGGATRTVMTDRRRAAGRRAREMAATMRARAQLGRDEASRAIRRVTGDLADLAEGAAAQAAAVLRNGRRAIPKALSGRMRGRLRRALGELAVTIGRTATVVAQARSRLAGQMPGGATRLVSLHDPDARPIRKGRTGKPAGVRIQGPGPGLLTWSEIWCDVENSKSFRSSRHCRVSPGHRLKGASALHNSLASIFTAPGVTTWSDMSGNARKSQVTRLVTLRHRSTMSGALRSPATTTASSWITASRPAIRRTLPSLHQRSAGSRGAPAARPVRSPPTAGTASPRPSGNCRPSGYAPSPSRAERDPQPPAVPSSTPAASARSSSGEPAAKAGSAISSADTAGTAPGWTAAKGLPSGAGTGYSATTWSRSAPSPADLPRPDPRTPPVPPPEISLRTFSGRSNLGPGSCRRFGSRLAVSPRNGREA